jgi:chloramphenicol O-acetyltransferase
MLTIKATGGSTTVPEAMDIQYEPAGTLCDFRTLYQTKPDGYGMNSWTKEVPVDLPDTVEDAESAQYALLVRKKKCYDGRRSLSIHSIVVQSERLKEFLKRALKDYPGITTTLKRLEVTSPFRPFVHRWEAITKLRDEEQDPTTKAHVDMFYRIMDEELRDVIDRKNDLVAKGVITHDLAWTILEPQGVVLSSSGGALCAYSFAQASSEDEPSETDFFAVEYVDFDGSKFGYVSTAITIPNFPGTTPITSLPIYPLRYHPEKDTVQELLISRGKKWEAYKGYHFKSYEPSTSTDSKSQDDNSKSRVIIDIEAYNINGQHNGRMRPSHVGREIDGELDDAQRLIATPMLYGYSLKDKEWRSFHVDHLRDIEWDDKAFESLVLPREQEGLKEVILAVAKAQSKKLDTFDDVVRGKGQGFIMQLSGPPGVGKTLTAESVAEVMRVPLYVMSAGDLGVDARGFETKLKSILQLIPKWGAVLLLDEADVFMEARDSNNLDRNELVSIFLRMLEYYKVSFNVWIVKAGRYVEKILKNYMVLIFYLSFQGILFLTTNRTQNIDPAFESRIHISLTYRELDAESRRQVWTQFLSRSLNIEAFTDEQLDQVAELQLNGRQIKNVIKTAGLLAWSKGREVRFEDLKMVLALRDLQK